MRAMTLEMTGQHCFDSLIPPCNIPTFHACPQRAISPGVQLCIDSNPMASRAKRFAETMIDMSSWYCTIVTLKTQGVANDLWRVQQKHQVTRIMEDAP